jgi:hypothetical protein
MRFVVAYEPELHPLTKQSLAKYCRHAEPVRMGNGPTAYWELLCRLWDAKEAFTIIEHDIELHDKVVRPLTYCKEPWCVFPYGGPPQRPDAAGVIHPPMLITTGLGCTRFRASMMRDHPNFMSELGPTYWQALDSHIHGRLDGLGYKRHLHYPAVTHHHDYPAGCACGQEH